MVCELYKAVYINKKFIYFYLIEEIPGWLSGLAPAFGPRSDPGDLGSSPTPGSLHGACLSFCLCLHLSLFLCL